MNDAVHEIMTIDEVAVYLRIPESTIYRLAQQGRIPANKVGRQWRFRRELIDRWLGESIIHKNSQPARIIEHA